MKKRGQREGERERKTPKGKKKVEVRERIAAREKSEAKEKGKERRLKVFDYDRKNKRNETQGREGAKEVHKLISTEKEREREAGLRSPHTCMYIC